MSMGFGTLVLSFGIPNYSFDPDALAGDPFAGCFFIFRDCLVLASLRPPLWLAAVPLTARKRKALLRSRRG